MEECSFPPFLWTPFKTTVWLKLITFVHSFHILIVIFDYQWLLYCFHSSRCLSTAVFLEIMVSSWMTPWFQPAYPSDPLILLTRLSFHFSPKSSSWNVAISPFLGRALLEVSGIFQPNITTAAKTLCVETLAKARTRVKVVKIDCTVCLRPASNPVQLALQVAHFLLYLPSVQLPVADIPHFRISECQGLHPSLFRLFWQVLKERRPLKLIMASSIDSWYCGVNICVKLWIRGSMNGRSLNSLS